MEEIRLKLRSFITDNFLFGRAEERLSDDDSLIEKGIIDSTGVLQLVAFLEQECGIHVEDDEIIPDNLDSLSKLTAYTCRKLNLPERGAHAKHELRAAPAVIAVSTAGAL